MWVQWHLIFIATLLCAAANRHHDESHQKSISREVDSQRSSSESKSESKSSESESEERGTECSLWGSWQQSKCLWPTMDYSSIPESCKVQRKNKQSVLQEYKTAKAKEIYDVIGALFANRGANKTCGYCSRKIKCRTREESSEDRSNKCSGKEFEVIDEDCEGTEPCQLSTVMGGCPAPVPQIHESMIKQQSIGYEFGQRGQFHYYCAHWDRLSRRRRGPRAAEVGLPFARNRSAEIIDGNTNQEAMPLLNQSKEDKGGEKTGDLITLDHTVQRRNTDLPLWHCIK